MLDTLRLLSYNCDWLVSRHMVGLTMLKGANHPLQGMPKKLSPPLQRIPMSPAKALMLWDPTPLLVVKPQRTWLLLTGPCRMEPWVLKCLPMWSRSFLGKALPAVRNHRWSPGAR